MIHALLLSLALAAQGTPVHAGFHPSEADAYLELGDVSAILPLLDGAPVLRILRDARLKALLEEAGVAPDLPLKDLVKLGFSTGAPEAKAETWFDGLKNVSVSFVALGPGSDTQSGAAFQLLADFASEEQAKALQAAIVSEAPKHETISAALPGVELLHMGDPSDDIWCVTVGARLVVGSTSSKVDDYAARADKKLPALASRESFQKQLAALEKTSGAPLMWFALSRPVGEIMKTLQKEGEGGGLAFLEQLPSDLNPLASARVARVQLVGDRFVTEMISADDSQAATTKPVDPAWLEPLAQSSMLVYASTFDGAAAGQRMRALLARDEQSAASLAALEQKLGFGPERVLGRLGPGLAASLAPISGLSLEARVWVDCEDPAAFTADFEALVGALGETLPGFAAKTKPYKVKKAGTEERVEIPITTLTLPAEMNVVPMIQIAPSFAPIGKRLVFTLNSMEVKSELRRVIAADGDPIVPGTNPLSALGFAPPADARSVVMMDWGKLIGGLLATAKAFAGMVPPGELPFDLAKLPPPELFTDHLKPTFHFSRPLSGNLYRRNEGSFGPETWIGLFGSAALMGMRQQAAFSGAPSGEIPPLEKTGGGQ